MNLADDVLAGKRLSLARLLTQIENNTALGKETLSQLFPYTGRAHIIGITGAPGTGKSSLVNSLVRNLRQTDINNSPITVGIIAVDPSSPFSGGAILGDRVRMKDLSGDPGVFIRSMATRGFLGGLAATTTAMVQAFDAAGFGMIMIETVGAGQSEIDIAKLAHTTIVIESPGMGDDIQAIKAGILEIADILVINKADYPGVEITERALRANLDLAHPSAHVFRYFSNQITIPFETIDSKGTLAWEPPIVKTIASENKGIEELVKAIFQHRKFIQDNGDWKQREYFRINSEVNAILQEQFIQRWRLSVSEQYYREVLTLVYNKAISPWDAVQKLLSD